jgi:ketosteroid isomerase-like protein
MSAVRFPLASEDQSPAKPEEKPSLENPELEEFFHRLPSNLRWPKPSEEAIAAAAEAIQRMAGGVAGAELVSGSAADPGHACSGCGSSLDPGVHFCPQCGLTAEGSGTENAGGEPGIHVRHPEARNGAVHHYHHHYHHFVPAAPAGVVGPTAESPNMVAKGRVPGSPGTSSGGRAELSARQVAQDWAQACNTKHLDDLAELYATDATLIRSNLPPVRSLPAIREFLHALLEAGLGDLEMESLRTEVMGEIAMELGRCKMLVPVAMGKRREERGKYLLVLVRQPAGTWKILADCWSSDQVVSPPTAVDTARKNVEPGAPIRKPR